MNLALFTFFFNSILFTLLLYKILSYSFTETSYMIKIPSKVILGYANWQQCDDRLIKAVKNGVNVLMWTFINLGADSDGYPEIQSGPNLECAKEIIQQIKDLNLDVVHIISIGGWNAPHPDITNTALDVFQTFDNWNNQFGFRMFDGIDWDIEGNDDFSSPYNKFTKDELDLMGKFSQIAKYNGYVVTMAPAESYFDVTTSEFSLSLGFNYPEWQEIVPNFNYHGRNVYTYLFMFFKETKINDKYVDTFDLVIVQLYEGYSHALYNITRLEKPASDYLIWFTESMNQGWNVVLKKGELEGINRDTSFWLNVPNDKLVIGLANAWADNSKFLLIEIEELKKAFHNLEEKSLPPRGFGFWNIADEGALHNGSPYFLIDGLNEFMKVREISENTRFIKE
jgi:hypothetical protein